jgi:hypothetical protein
MSLKLLHHKIYRNLLERRALLPVPQTVLLIIIKHREELINISYCLRDNSVTMNCTPAVRYTILI